MPFLVIGVGLAGFGLGWWMFRCRHVPPAPAGPAAPADPEQALADNFTQARDQFPMQTKAPKTAVLDPAAPGSAGSSPPWPTTMVGVLRQPPPPEVW